jgi:hypothetical protein
MFFATITPEQASQPRVVSLDEQLHEAVNALLYSRFKTGKVTIYQDDVEDLIGSKRWNLGEHPQKLREVIERYSLSGWDVVDDTDNPHDQRWTFTKSVVASFSL